MATSKKEISPRDYINNIEHDRKREEALRIYEMMTTICGEEGTMWGSSIIGFQRYNYVNENGRTIENARLAFSPRKAQHVLYCLTGFPGQDELLAKLGKYKTGKVCLYINKLADVDWDILTDIVKRDYAAAIQRHPLD